MSVKDPKTQATKFLEQLKVLEAERLALYDELLDPESRALQREFDQLKVERATVEREVRSLRKRNQLLHAQLEAAGVAEDAPAASTKQRLKNAIFVARKKLKKAIDSYPPGSYPYEHSQMIREALSELERVVV